MRFATITFGLTALLSAFVAASPVDNSEIMKRMPTPEEFAILSQEKRDLVYKAWYRATNILPSVGDEKRDLVYKAW